MKSNSVVFPHSPIKNINKKIQTKQAYADIETDLATIAVLLPKNIFSKVQVQGKTAEEKILSIFLHPQVRFGPSSHITKVKSYWIDRIHFFTKKNKPLEFTILGFPGKAPVPIKTNRRMPDFGELTSLYRLHELTKLVKHFYKPGARISIISEGLLGSFIGLPDREARVYESTLAHQASALHWDDSLRFVPLGKMTLFPGYAKTFQKEYKKNIGFFNEKEKSFLKKYNAAYPSIFHLISTRLFPYEQAQDAYRKNPKTKLGKLLRRTIQKKAHIATLKYFAALAARDQVNFLEKTVPHYLALTVSPKPYRLGFQLVPNSVHLLAHHGVPFGQTIISRHELLTSQKPYIRVFLKEDTDQSPFLYLPYTT